MNFSRVQSLTLAALLEDCSYQLDILGRTLEIGINKDGGPKAPQNAVLTELTRLCESVSQHVSQLHSELEEKQSCGPLRLAIEEVEQEEATGARSDTKAELEQKRLALKMRHEELQQKNEELKDMERLIKDLIYELSEQSTKTDILERIVKREQEFQIQQGEKESMQAEKLLDEQVERLQKKQTDTNAAHECAMTFLQSRHKELQQQLQECRQRNEQMLQEREEQVDDVCSKKTALSDELEALKKSCAEMEQVVMEDREERQAEARAATKLQAWWRGCMVRRGLGRFKKEAEKGTKSKKKKGKKKK